MAATLRNMVLVLIKNNYPAAVPKSQIPYILERDGFIGSQDGLVDTIGRLRSEGLIELTFMGAHKRTAYYRYHQR